MVRHRVVVALPPWEVRGPWVRDTTREVVLVRPEQPKAVAQDSACQEDRELGQTQTQAHRRRLVIERVELEECQRHERETLPPGVSPQELRQRHTAEWQALKKRQGMG